MRIFLAVTQLSIQRIDIENMEVKEDDTFYEIERILAKRILKDENVEYLVHWKGCSIDDSTWQPANRLKDDYCHAYCNSLKEAFVQHDEVIVPMIVKRSTVLQVYIESPPAPAADESDLYELSQLSTELPPAGTDDNLAIKCNGNQADGNDSESLRHITGRRSVHENVAELSFECPPAEDDNLATQCNWNQADGNASESLRHITGRRSIHNVRMRDSFHTDIRRTSESVRIGDYEESKE